MLPSAGSDADIMVVKSLSRDTTGSPWDEIRENLLWKIVNKEKAFYTKMTYG